MPLQIAIEPKSKADNDKMGAALYKLAQEDPSFHFSRDDETNQTVIEGMGELHLDIIVDRMKREFNVAADIGAPQVSHCLGQDMDNDVKETKCNFGSYLERESSRGIVYMYLDLTMEFLILLSALSLAELCCLQASQNGFLISEWLLVAHMQGCNPSVVRQLAIMQRSHCGVLAFCIACQLSPGSVGIHVVSLHLCFHLFSLMIGLSQVNLTLS